MKRLLLTMGVMMAFVCGIFSGPVLAQSTLSSTTSKKVTCSAVSHTCKVPSMAIQRHRVKYVRKHMRRAKIVHVTICARHHRAKYMRKLMRHARMVNVTIVTRHHRMQCTCMPIRTKSVRHHRMMRMMRHHKMYRAVRHHRVKIICKHVRTKQAMKMHRVMMRQRVKCVCKLVRTKAVVKHHRHHLRHHVRHHRHHRVKGGGRW